MKRRALAGKREPPNRGNAEGLVEQLHPMAKMVNQI